MIRLTKNQILMLHAQLIKETGGSDGVRDENLLESAIETLFQTFGGEELYPGIQAKAARLCYGLVKNHAMVDGNKRIGAHAMLVFLALNGQELKYTQTEISVIVTKVEASGYLVWCLFSAESRRFSFFLKKTHPSG
ncbi:MAG: type II toxin-antitoxin system death-on-curing family toxin [Velocimicrobium sp.]